MHCTIHIVFSNKQFVDGNLAPDATEYASYTTTIISTPNGNWIAPEFSVPEKTNIWINAYAETKGYEVVLSNILVQ